jgi:predicted pyridoxine 5'-phosphate oxidase superfamily flavin-nucleotide-binding protein
MHSILALLSSTSDGWQVYRGEKNWCRRTDSTYRVSAIHSASTKLAIPDRQGNNRLDSMSNLLVNNETGLFFMIPGVHESPE